MLGHPLCRETTILHLGHCRHFFLPTSLINFLSSSAAPCSDEHTPPWACWLHRTHVEDRHWGQVPTPPARDPRGTKAAHRGSQQYSLSLVTYSSSSRWYLAKSASATCSLIRSSSRGLFRQHPTGWNGGFSRLSSMLRVMHWRPAVSFPVPIETDEGWGTHVSTVVVATWQPADLDRGGEADDTLGSGCHGTRRMDGMGRRRRSEGTAAEPSRCSRTGLIAPRLAGSGRGDDEAADTAF